MSAHKITATFANGHVATRKTAAPYTHASRRQVGTQAGRGATVRFHTSESAARAAAGRYGEVVRTDFVAEAAAAEAAAETWIVTYADGETREVHPTVRLSPVAIGREARPDVAVIGAQRKR